MLRWRRLQTKCWLGWQGLGGTSNILSAAGSSWYISYHDGLQEFLSILLTLRYRRGKELSNDVDIVITRQSSDEKDIDHICQYLVSQLLQAG